MKYMTVLKFIPHTHSSLHENCDQVRQFAPFPPAPALALWACYILSNVGQTSCVKKEQRRTFNNENNNRKSSNFLWGLNGGE